MEKSSEENIENKISEFWQKDIWKCNTKHIHNEKIKNILIQIQKLRRQAHSTHKA